MKTKNHSLIFVILFLLGWLLVVSLPVVVGATAADESSTESKPEKTAASQPSSTTSSFDPSKYLYRNLPELEQKLIRKKATSGIGEDNQNQLTLNFRVKQDSIRFYEVILLATMSLLSLAIVLKYMKDSKMCGARDMLNGTGLVLVIFSTVLVIIIADVEIQLTAAMGVLGGIAGYLFGTLRSSLPANTEGKKENPSIETGT